MRRNHGRDSLPTMTAGILTISIHSIKRQIRMHKKDKHPSENPEIESNVETTEELNSNPEFQKEDDDSKAETGSEKQEDFDEELPPSDEISLLGNAFKKITGKSENFDEELPPADEVSILREAMKKIAEERDHLKEEKDHFHDSYMRTLAEFKNFRNRTEVEKSNMRESAHEGLVVRILPILDNFERTLKSIESGASIESIKEGVRAVERHFKNVLTEFHVVRLESQGQPFDPDIHEALATHETDEHPENTVIDEIEPGYVMGKKVIRPAKVRVSKKSEKDS